MYNKCFILELLWMGVIACSTIESLTAVSEAYD